MRRVAAFLAVLFAIAGPLWAAAPSFPALTGRVVDDAHLLSPQTQQELTQHLAAFEAQTSHQIVVVTVPDLQKLTIEDYGYQLGRHWGIGQKGKNNGALLIVAPQAHKVRIETGYGLEGTLTDAQASQIVQAIILPRFRAGQMEQGIVAGTQAMVATLGGEWAVGASTPVQTGQMLNIDLFPYILMLIVVFSIIQRLRGRSSGFGFLPWLFIGGGGGRSRDNDDDSFSGGGGSFGGGGASGSW